VRGLQGQMAEEAKMRWRNTGKTVVAASSGMFSLGGLISVSDL
jgi:hypothetical protein